MLRFGFGSSPVGATSSSSTGGTATGTGGGTNNSSSRRSVDDKYVKMLRRELEGDSVDTDILDEELRYLKEAEPKTYVQVIHHYHHQHRHHYLHFIK